MAEILAAIEAEIRVTEGVAWKELLIPANRYRVFIIVTLQIGMSHFPYSVVDLLTTVGVQLTGNTSLAYCECPSFACLDARN